MNVFEAARSADCIRAAENLGLRVRRSGSKAYAPCLFHADRSPSMCLYPDGGGFYCFSCHAHGDAASLYAQALGLRALDAARRVCEDFGLAYDDGRGGAGRPPTAQQREQERKRRRQAAEQQLLGEAQREKERRVTQLTQDRARFAALMQEAEAQIVPRGGYEALSEDPRWQRLMMAVCGVQDETDRLDAMDDADLIAWAMAELSRRALENPTEVRGEKGAMQSAYAQRDGRGRAHGGRPPAPQAMSRKEGARDGG